MGAKYGGAVAIFLSMKRLVITIALFGTCIVGASASTDSCLAALRPHLTITEKILLEVSEQWPQRVEIEGEERERFLRFAGYADSTGSVSSRILAEQLTACTDSASGISLGLIRVRGIEGNKDESIFLAVSRGSELTARVLVASLQAGCDNTFLRACTMLDDFSIRLEQLRHDFDCEKDEFLATVVLDGMTVRVRPDGTINESVDGEQPVPTDTPSDED